METVTKTKYTIDLDKYPECKPLVEEAGRLIKVGKSPSITLDRGINFAVRSKKPYKEYRWQILELYTDPSYAAGTCLHEAAHAILMDKNGEQNIRFCGPGIRRENGVLFPYAACVKCDPKPAAPLTEDLIFQTTTLLTVGGVAMEKYSGIKELSDRKDYDEFVEKCRITPPGFIKEKPEDLWKRAQERASKWIDVAETKTKVFERASEYLLLLYS